MPLPRTLRWPAAALALLALFAMVGCERGGPARYSDCLLYERYAHPVAALAVPETVRLLDHVDDGLWVLGEGQSLHTVDLSDPRAPRELGVVELPDQVAFHANVATDGSHVYVPVRKQQSGLLAAIDLSDPRHPVLESVITLPGMAHAIAVRGSQGWVPTLDAGLCRLDLSDPSAPQLAERFRALGARRIAMTFGAGGAWLEVDGARADMGVPVVDVVDAVGAGDTFWGNCIGDWAQQASDAAQRVAATLAAAMQAAAINCTRAGCQPPRHAQVLAALGVG